MGTGYAIQAPRGQYHIGRRLAAGLVLALFTVLGARAQDASALLTTSQDKLLVGDQARVFVTVQHNPALSSVSWTAVPDSFEKLEVVRKEKIDTIKKGAFVQYRQTLLVSGYDSGAWTIPPFQFTVTPKSGAPYTIQTGLLNMSVTTVPVDTTKPFKPIKGIMIVETSWRDYIWWMAAALAALIIGVVLYFLLRKKKVAPPPPPAPEVPLHVRTLQALEALEKEGLWQRGEVKAYYVRLTDILRGYIEARFGVPAMERTTDELTAAARHHAELTRFSGQLYTILSTADMAKFARAQPTPEEHFASMQATKDFVTPTIPVAAPADAAAHLQPPTTTAQP